MSSSGNGILIWDNVELVIGEDRSESMECKSGSITGKSAIMLKFLSSIISICAESTKVVSSCSVRNITSGDDLADSVLVLRRFRLRLLLTLW